jgi:hypothetical protein
MGSLPTIAKDDNVPTGFADVSEQNHRSGPPSEMWLVGFAARRASYLGVSGKEGDNIEKKKATERATCWSSFTSAEATANSATEIFSSAYYF